MSSLTETHSSVIVHGICLECILTLSSTLLKILVFWGNNCSIVFDTWFSLDQPGYWKYHLHFLTLSLVFDVSGILQSLDLWLFLAEYKVNKKVMHKDSGSSAPAMPTARLRRRRGSNEVICSCNYYYVLIIMVIQNWLPSETKK